MEGESVIIDYERLDCWAITRYRVELKPSTVGTVSVQISPPICFTTSYWSWIPATCSSSFELSSSDLNQLDQIITRYRSASYRQYQGAETDYLCIAWTNKNVPMMVEQYRSDVYKIDKNGGGFSDFIAVLQ